jgi:hypothetical protein
MSFPHGAVTAALAARRRRQQEEQDRIEEEEMTNYSVDELDSNWEFKIVRSETGAFRRGEVFQQLLQEEAVAGWELVEKLDDRRVRFKRRKQDRRKDASLPAGIDPYRSQFGGGAARSLIAVLVGLGVLIAVGAGLLISLTGGDSSGGIAWVMIANAGIVVLILVLMLIAIIARRR